MGGQGLSLISIIQNLEMVTPRLVTLELKLKVMLTCAKVGYLQQLVFLMESSNLKITLPLPRIRLSVTRTN